MKEIKFRAWDKIDKKMRIVNSLFFNEDGTIDIFCKDLKDPLYLDKDLNELELIQFTGMLDKEGKEIYEGDILDTCYGKGVVKLGIVRIDDNEGYADNLISGFYFEGPNENISKKHLGDIIDGVEPPEIIGNIWEDSHLLGDSHIWENKELLESD